jgi:hypothetical protein
LSEAKQQNWLNKFVTELASDSGRFDDQAAAFYGVIATRSAVPFEGGAAAFPDVPALPAGCLIAPRSIAVSRPINSS